jgi:hypothetical protein
MYWFIGAGAFVVFTAVTIWLMRRDSSSGSGGSGGAGGGGRSGGSRGQPD